MMYFIIVAVILAGIFLVRRAANRAEARKREQQNQLRDQAVAEGATAAREGKGESACPYPNAGFDPGIKPVGVMEMVASPAERVDPRYWWLGGHRNAIKSLSKNMPKAAAPQQQGLPEDLKAYVTRLRKVLGQVGSFASPDTVKIGEEIYQSRGHAGMVKVCDEIRAQVGAGPARDLEYKWNGVGEWQG